MTSPIVHTRATRSSPQGFTALELAPDGRRSTAVTANAKEANANKENVVPSPSPTSSSAAERKKSTRSASKSQIDEDDMDSQTIAVAGTCMADRVKTTRRPSTKRYGQASPLRASASQPAQALPLPVPASLPASYISEAARAIATFALTKAPPPTPASVSQQVAPQNQPKRKGGQRTQRKKGSKNQFTPRDQLSQTPKAVWQRAYRAAQNPMPSTTSCQLQSARSLMQLSENDEESPDQPDQEDKGASRPEAAKEVTLLPQPMLKRKASSSFEGSSNGSSSKRHLSHTSKAISLRNPRAAEKEAHSAVSVLEGSQRMLSSSLRSDTPTSSSTFVGTPRPKKSNQSTPVEELSQTPNAIWIRNKKAERKAALAQSSSQPGFDVTLAKVGSFLQEEERKTRATSSRISAGGDVPKVPEDFEPAQAENKRSLRSQRSGSSAIAGTTGPVSGRNQITAGTYQDIRDWQKDGEDLDWTKITDKKERVRIQNLISSRKYCARKKAAGTSPTPQKGRQSGRASEEPAAMSDKPPKSSRRLVIYHDPDRSSPRQAQRSPTESISPAHNMTKKEALELTDDEFVVEVKAVLEATSKRGGKSMTFAVRHARRIQNLLNVASPPEAGEALFVSGDEALKRLGANQYFSGPIFTSGQQTLPLQTVDQFFSECYDNDVEVFVQDPAVRVARGAPHVRSVTMADVKNRFAKPATHEPWNLLELAAHCEDGLRPPFLNTEDCRLLTKLKFPGSADKASRKGYDPGWKEVEKWALVAQAGALTEPHQDSHGYSTYITVNQGILGYGWLSNPTAEERVAWSKSHNTFIGGRWRYVILRPGQTVAFPAGTVHFVFRLPAVGNTLAFGGHFLRCSQIVRWIKTLIEEKAAPDITNEDLTVSAPGYLDRTAKFVRQAMQTGEEWKWGGRGNIEEFLRLKVDFERMKKG